MRSMYTIIYILAITFTVIGALNWGFVGAFGVNVAQKILKNPIHRRFFYVLIGMSSFYLITQKNIWFPYLGKTMIPCNILRGKKPKNPTHIVDLKIIPGSKVIYWAVGSNNKNLKKISKNSGVTMCDKRGIAKLKFKIPKDEKITHIHYRVCQKDLMLGPVKMIKLE